MCIALLSTAHPAYPLILIDNRDEFINRPTAVANWWSVPHDNVLAGRDLLKDVQGTWLGVTREGRVAVLTNFRDEDDGTGQSNIKNVVVSRGEIVRRWLTGKNLERKQSRDDTITATTATTASAIALNDDTVNQSVDATQHFVDEMVNSGLARNAGGFTCVCGVIGEKLAVLSNRAATSSHVPWICGDLVQTIGLSNAAFEDRSWWKVREGEELMLRVIQDSVNQAWTENRLIEEFLTLLSRDTLRRGREGDKNGQERDNGSGGKVDGGLEIYVKELRNTILVPALGKKVSTPTVANPATKPSDYKSDRDQGNDRKQQKLKSDELAAARDDGTTVKVDPSHHQLGISGLYGTLKQTVMLVDRELNVRFFERTLFDEDSDPVPVGKGDVDYKFQIKR